MKQGSRLKDGFMVFEPRICRVYQAQVHVDQHLRFNPGVDPSNASKLFNLVVDGFAYPAVE